MWQRHMSRWGPINVLLYCQHQSNDFEGIMTRSQVFHRGSGSQCSPCHWRRFERVSDTAQLLMERSSPWQRPSSRHRWDHTFPNSDSAGQTGTGKYGSSLRSASRLTRTTWDPRELVRNASSPDRFESGFRDVVRIPRSAGSLRHSGPVNRRTGILSRLYAGPIPG